MGRRRGGGWGDPRQEGKGKEKAKVSSGGEKRYNKREGKGVESDNRGQ